MIQRLERQRAFAGVANQSGLAGTTGGQPTQVRLWQWQITAQRLTGTEAQCNQSCLPYLHSAAMQHSTERSEISTFSVARALHNTTDVGPLGSLVALNIRSLN